MVFLITHQWEVRVLSSIGLLWQFDLVMVWFVCLADLGTAGENVKRVKMYTFLRKHATGVATTELHIVHVERGMSWQEVMERWGELTGSKEGFYLSHQVRMSVWEISSFWFVIPLSQGEILCIPFKWWLNCFLELVGYCACVCIYIYLKQVWQMYRHVYICANFM